MSTQKRFEVGVDYEGVSLRHLQVNEEIVFSNEEASRIFMPECGAFYVESLDIKDSATGKTLKIWEDFEVFVLDTKATKESGKQVCGLIVIKNPSVNGVLLNYQFVGGIHSSGYYVLEQLLKMYPKGTSAIISFDEILNKPTEFDPAYHTQHVSELFGTDTLLIWLERARQAIHHRQNQSLTTMYTQAQTLIDSLYVKLEANQVNLTKQIEDVLKSISVQTDEYILTDSAENPAVKRGYGTWELISNTLLRGGPAGNFLVGTGSLIAMGSEQIIRNCYIWYNKQNSNVNEARVEVTTNKDTVAEGETITFTLSTTNVPNATKLEWFIEGHDNKDISNNATGIGITTVNNGTATVTLTIANDRKTEGNEAFVFRLRDFPNVSKNFLVLDTSLDRRITAINFLNSNNAVVETIIEDAKFKLRISTVGLIGQTVFLKWSTDVQFLTSIPPNSVVITSNTQDIPLEIIGNLAPNVTRVVEVTATEISNEVIDETTPKAVVYILDTSQELLASIVFLNSSNLTVTNIDEDANFKINIRTNGGIGQKLKLSYRAVRPLSEFTGLLSEVTIGSNNEANIVAKHTANYLTATTTEFLEVTVTSAVSNQVLAVGTLLLNDTTKNPNFIVNISDGNAGVGVKSTVNEGEDFYLVFKVPGWVGSVTPPAVDVVLTFTGAPSQNERLLTPSRLTNIRFDDKNNLDRVEWLNGDTLALRFSTIADKAIYGDAEVSIKWKMSIASTYTDGPTISIIDTSKPTLTASWSSSATELTPITQVNEMQSNGTDNTCYLFLDVDGDGSTFTGLNLDFDQPSPAGAADLIQVYPRSLAVAKGSNRLIVRVDILADFLTEGSEMLKLKVLANGLTNPLVTASLTVIDNSVLIPITSTRPVSGIYGTTTYSEWENVTITLNLQPLAFATDLVITATNANKVDGLVAGTYSIPANQTSYTITMSAKKIRHENGDYAVGITAKRMLGAKTVSPPHTINTNFINDRIFPRISAFNVYSDSTGTTLATKLLEGQSYWVKVTIDRPLANTLVVVGNSVATSTDSGTKAGTGRFVFTNNRKVVLKAAEVNGLVDTALIAFTVPYDRKTNPAGLLLELVAKIDWSSINSSLTVGSSYTQTLIANNADERVLNKTLTIDDLSKTLVVTGNTSNAVNGASVTSFDEGDNIFFNFTLTNPTQGDVYELILHPTNNQVPTTRYLTHQFSSKDISIINNGGTQTLNFTAALLKNYLTDGDKTGAVILRNKTAGTDEHTLTFTVIDTTKTPTLTARWTNTAGTTISSVNEGDSFKLEITTTNLPVEFPIRLINATGRTLVDFTTSPLNTPQTIVNEKTAFTFVLSENFKVDSVNNFGVTAEVVGLPVSLVVPTLTINDTSKAPTYNIRWIDLAGNPLTQTNEGSYIELEVVARGVAVGATLSVTLSGAGITTADVVGGALTKTASFQSLGTTGNVIASVNWNLANDLLTEGTEAVVATVKINAVQVGTANLSIIDTSLTPPTFSAYITSDAAGNNRITTANEGDTVYAIIEAANLVSNFSTTWGVFGNTGGTNADGTWVPFNPMSGNVTVKNGKTAVALQIPNNYFTTGNMISSIGFWIPALGNQALSPNLTIVDVYKTPSFRGLIWSRNMEGTDPVTTLNPGEDINLVILTKNILPGQQFEISYPVMDGLTVADFDYGPHTGTAMTSITQYDAATGEGRRAIGFRVKA